jgi:hypothetical protein
MSVVKGAGWRVLSLFVGYPNDQSVIEEKGEGFENGKILLAHLDLPSTSNNPPRHKT